MFVRRYQTVGEDDVQTMVKQRQTGLIADGSCCGMDECFRAASFVELTLGGFQKLHKVVPDENIPAPQGRNEHSVFNVEGNLVGKAASEQYGSAGFNFVCDVGGAQSWKFKV